MKIQTMKSDGSLFVFLKILQKIPDFKLLWANDKAVCPHS